MIRFVVNLEASVQNTETLIHFTRIPQNVHVNKKQTPLLQSLKSKSRFTGISTTWGMHAYYCYIKENC